MSDLVQGQLRTRLFPPIDAQVSGEQVAGTVLDRLIGTGGAAQAQSGSVPQLSPSTIGLLILQPRFVLRTPVGDVDQAPAGDPGNAWVFWLPFLALVFVLGLVELVRIIFGRR